MKGPIIFSTMQENGYLSTLFQNLRIPGVKSWSIQTSDALAGRGQRSQVTAKGSGIRTISQQHLKLGDNGSSNSKEKLYQTQYSLSSQLSISHANRITFPEVKILQSLPLHEPFLWKLKEGGSTAMRVNKEKARGQGTQHGGGVRGFPGMVKGVPRWLSGQQAKMVTHWDYSKKPGATRRISPWSFEHTETRMRCLSESWE